jgi:hypothetical protein
MLAKVRRIGSGQMQLSRNSPSCQRRRVAESAVEAQDGITPAKDAVLIRDMVELLSIWTHLSRRLARTHDTRMLYAAAKGGGRSSAIIRRMSENEFLGMATSAIWKAT